MPLATELGKEAALQALEQRRKENKGKKRIDNRTLPAGSPMHYYCVACGGSMVLPELHREPAPQLCAECSALKACGWLK